MLLKMKYTIPDQQWEYWTGRKILGNYTTECEKLMR